MSGISSTYHSNFADGAEILQESLNSNCRFQNKVRIRYVLVQHNKDWQVPLIVAHIFTEDEKPTPSSDMDYTSTRLCEEWISIESLVNCFKTRRLELTKVTFLFKSNQNWERSFLSSNNKFHKNPGHLYLVGWQEHSGQVNHDILLNYELPYYPDVIAAIREWVGISDYTSSHSYTGKFMFFVPECRACVQTLERNDQKLIINVKKIQGLNNLRIKGAFWIDSHNDKFERFDEAVSPPGIAGLNLPPNTARLEFFLIGSNDKLYDYHREGRWPLEGVRSVLSNENTPDSNEQLVTQAIRSGEGLTVEFKPYLDLASHKIDELIRTAIAFSNKIGGQILIGVDNDCQVTGIEREVIKRYRGTSDLNVCVQKYSGELLQLIRTRVTPSVDLYIEDVSYAGHRVLLIKINQGNEKPYRDHQGEHLYIRRGSSNVQPNNEELRDLLTANRNEDRWWANA